MTDILEILKHAPDNARFSIISPNCESIGTARELKDLVDELMELREIVKGNVTQSFNCGSCGETHTNYTGLCELLYDEVATVTVRSLDGAIAGGQRWTDQLVPVPPAKPIVTSVFGKRGILE